MPDITAARPLSGAPVESAWGGQVHDAVEGLQAGQATATIAAGANSGTVIVTFPRAYTAAPNVVATVGPLGSQVFVANISGISATTVTLNAFRKDETNQGSSLGVPVQWMALGVPA